jgi:defect-in-organelle-trafficking protein DotB
MENDIGEVSLTHAAQNRAMSDGPLSLSEQRVEPQIIDNYRPGDGIVIVSGAAYSGRSTLIGGMTEAMLSDPNAVYHICEGAERLKFRHERRDGSRSLIWQSEIPKHLPTLPAFIRGAIHREPTDIIIGECRDPETMGEAVNAAMCGISVKTILHAQDCSRTMQRVSILLPNSGRAYFSPAVAQAMRMVINQRLVPCVDGGRIAIREFLVFDKPLRDQLLRANTTDWPALTRQAIEDKGQSYRKAIEIALKAGLITEQTAAYQLRQVA